MKLFIKTPKTHWLIMVILLLIIHMMYSCNNKPFLVGEKHQLRLGVTKRPPTKLVKVTHTEVKGDSVNVTYTEVRSGWSYKTGFIHTNQFKKQFRIAKKQ